jgi:glycosyltransferase involved in cell wall biosynthesis
MGGAERSTYEFARRLHGAGDVVDVVCLREAGEVGEMFRSAGVDVVSDLSPSARDPRTVSRLAQHFRTRSTDTIYFLDHTNAVFWGVQAARMARVPVRLLVVHTTGLWGGGSSLPAGIRSVLPGITHVIATARDQCEYLVELGIPRDKLDTIRNGVETGPELSSEDRLALRAELSIREDELAVGMTAMFRPEKAHEVLFDACTRLRERHPGLRVFLLGDGPRREELVTAVHARELGDIVTFLGLRRDAPRLAPAFDVVCLTSKPQVETLPFALLEAIACGVPAVATRVGSLAELVEDGGAGTLVPPDDTEAFSVALDRVLSDDTLRHEMGQSGRMWVKSQFSVERVVHETRELISAAHGVRS